MTLVAAFTAVGVPALVGDFLTTSGGESSELRRKVIRISPALAVAWTGSLLTANRLITALMTWPPGAFEDEAALRAYFSSIAPDLYADGEIELVGWAVLSAGPVAVLWQSGVPEVLSVDAAGPYFRGSGREIADEIFRWDPKADSSDPPAVRLLQAEQEIVGAISQLIIRDRTLSGRPTDTFGFAYEALIYTGDDFRYISGVRFAFSRVEVDSHGDLLSVNTHLALATAVRRPAGLGGPRRDSPGRRRPVRD